MSGRILVTGASGFVGRVLVAALAETGKPVRAATREPGTASFPPGVEVVAVPDFRQDVDWAQLFEGVEAVVHLAGIAHVGRRIDAATYNQVIHRATADLAHACAKAGVARLIFMSSVRAQSGAAADHVLHEDELAHPSEDYGRAKLEAETAVRSGATPWTILRPVMVYGAGVAGNLAALLRLADSPWPLPFAAFANERSLVSLDNLIAAVLFALANPATRSQIYLVADIEPVTFAQIVASLRRGLGRPPRLFSLPPALFAAPLKLIGKADVWERLGGSLVVDPGKLMRAGWQPQGDTKAGLERLAAASRAAG